MSSSLLLCHGCFTWVVPRGDRCPQCGEIIDPATPDPPLYRLQETLGRLLEPLGEASLRRSLLPNQGMLYVTTRGLLFVPYDDQDDDQQQPPHEAASHGEPRKPLLPAILGAVRRIFRIGRRRRIRPKRRLLRVDESHRLAQLLMDDPGVFFVPHGSIRRLRCWAGSWTIVRREGTRLRVRPDPPARKTLEQMTSMCGFGNRQSLAPTR